MLRAFARGAAPRMTRAAPRAPQWTTPRVVVAPSPSPSPPRTFVSMPSGPAPNPAAWLRERLDAAKAAATTRLDAATAAKDAATLAAKRSLRANLALVVGPRAAATLLDGGGGVASFAPSSVARRALDRSRAFASRHATALTTAAGAAATLVVYGVVSSATAALSPVLAGHRAAGGWDARAEAMTLALSGACVAAGWTFVRRRGAVDAERVVSLAMRKLEAHAGVREVLGHPLVASEARAVAFTGGKWTRRAAGGGAPGGASDRFGFGLGFFARASSFALSPPTWRPRKIHAAWTVRGARKSAIVTVDAKRANGAYRFNLVAVDVAADDGGGEHRVYVEGGPADDAVGEQDAGEDEDGTSIVTVARALRAPLRSVSSEAYERHQAAEEAREAAARRRRREDDAARAAPRRIDDGGGRWPAERFFDAIAGAAHRARMAFGKAARSARGVGAARADAVAKGSR